MLKFVWLVLQVDFNAQLQMQFQVDLESGDITPQPATNGLVTERTHDHRPCTLHAHHMAAAEGAVLGCVGECMFVCVWFLHVLHDTVCACRYCYVYVCAAIGCCLHHPPHLVSLHAQGTLPVLQTCCLCECMKRVLWACVRGVHEVSAVSGVL